MAKGEKENLKERKIINKNALKKYTYLYSSLFPYKYVAQVCWLAD